MGKRKLVIKNIPTNIITGALGVGKTTTIQSLLEHRPKNERWAVLINEFGEVGIDGEMLSATSNEPGSKQIFIKEVPGGCMCCTSGLPMQIAMNLLLAQAKPHRLLIEPTGLGHPKEVLQTLTQPHYQDVLDVQATLTLIDIRKLENQKWRNHPTFREQMQIADTVVVTKSDLYSLDFTDSLRDFMVELDIASTPIAFANRGKIDSQLLKQTCSFKQQLQIEKVHHHAISKKPPAPLVAPEHGTLKIANQGEGYYSRGWLCSYKRQFNYKQCWQLLRLLDVERLKAVINTDEGVFGFNIVDGVFAENPLLEAKDTRIELISSDEAKADYFADIIETALCIDS
jgi:G3E family GTPase